MARTSQSPDVAAIVAAVMAQMASDESPAPKAKGKAAAKTSGGKSGPKQLTAKHTIRGGQLKALQARLRAADLDYDENVSVVVTIGGKSYGDWLKLSKLIASL